LPWAPTPAVPPLLSKPAPISRPPEARLPVFRDPSLRAIERAIDRKGRRSRLLEKRKAQSERNGRALSRLPLKHMSTRWTDPLSALEVEAETHSEYIMPFANGRVTSLFNQGRRHPAIDLAGALGSPVFATTTGQTVVFAARRGGYGNAVITRDVFGWTHLYGHLKSITARVGQVLDQGEKLGQLGSTGHSTGPHVHYEVRDGKGRHVNPVGLLFSGRRVAIGLAWADVGQFGAPSQVASRAADGERLASAAPLEAVPRRPSTTLKSSRRQRSRARHVHAARYAHRVRRAGLDDGD
jgi:peptidase M23-like protein